MATGEYEDDDNFSFPTTTHSPPRFIGSPRLWRSSSNAHVVHQTKQLSKQDQKRISMLSYVRKKDGDGSGENMDVIWEDLNYEDEMCGGRVSCDFGREWGKGYGEVTVACGGGRRRSMVVVVNVLKKLLLAHNTSRHWSVKK
ncbi:hypothetical protein QVD17_02240 [Tagetes erecta]|uniref:Uncharacterized protein n=1 Tax=Tagetes erecta TaxID=13708 RepID=A0AAD8L685_TARER|nr:hypothetical protein QVD17_02240 [Tagetes erecta]